MKKYRSTSERMTDMIIVYDGVKEENLEPVLAWISAR
jgi:hypothetical protein